MMHIRRSVPMTKDFGFTEQRQPALSNNAPMHLSRSSVQPLLKPARYLGNFALDVIGQRRYPKYDLHNTIVLSCSPRGGSTWLAQVFSELSGYVLLWEQLHFLTNPGAEKYGFGHPRYVRINDIDEVKIEYIRRVLGGYYLSTGVRSQYYFRPMNLLWFKGYCHKFVFANLLLPWLVHHFPVKCIYLIRHPCAVVSSQLRHPGWFDFDKQSLDHPLLFEDCPHLKEVYESVRSKAEMLAFDWALQNYVPLNAKSSARWVTTTYERLIRSGADEIKYLFQSCGFDISDRALQALDRPSVTAAGDAAIRSGRDPLAGWRERLSRKEVTDILDVVHRCGIHIYSEDPVGDESFLER